VQCKSFLCHANILYMMMLKSIFLSGYICWSCDDLCLCLVLVAFTVHTKNVFLPIPHPVSRKSVEDWDSNGFKKWSIICVIQISALEHTYVRRIWAIGKCVCSDDDDDDDDDHVWKSLFVIQLFSDQWCVSSL